jgi:3-oxoacyl-[acyl-carrier-protein] synthase-3
MLFSEFKNMKIAGISVAVPTQKLAVDSYNEIFGEEVVSKFIEMTGVKTVSRAIPQQTASDLGYEAAINLFKKSKADKEDIGILIFVSQKPDYRVPSTAFVLHKRLGLSKNCICFDINLACSGFLFGMQTILSLLQNSDANSALLITGDTSHKTLSPFDRTMIMLFGDSGSATLFKKEKTSDPIYIGLRTDGSRFKSIITPSGAYRNIGAPVERVEWSDGILRSDYDTHMKGMDVFGFSITDVPLLLKDFLETLKTSPESYNCFALHQANMYILKQISRKIKIPMDKISISLDRFGNNSSNSIPLVLSDNFGNHESGAMRTLMSGFGAGLSWAVADAVIEVSNIYPLIETDDYYAEGQTVFK